MGGDVLSHSRGRIHPGEQRRLAGGALWQAGDAEAGVNGPEDDVPVAATGGEGFAAIEDKWPAEQLAEARHWHITERIVRPRGRQSDAVEEHKQHAASSIESSEVCETSVVSSLVRHDL